ncbi:hypothetical protein [Zobellia laminariae]|uniref:hypothetical protein n=1 Tax=Zobellia laminariae TaxID=248906 RepID=UPI0026F420C8|nr:hypothetical protein [Zobellia laminariae]WKX76072.1 hypothetical protein Q5W13_21230 [Zobellia laminariae]
MKFKNLLFISTSLLIFGACSSDDLQIDVPDTDTEQPEEEEEEQVPGMVLLKHSIL